MGQHMEGPFQDVIFAQYLLSRPLINLTDSMLQSMSVKGFRYSRYPFLDLLFHPPLVQGYMLQLHWRLISIGEEKITQTNKDIEIHYQPPLFL